MTAEPPSVLVAVADPRQRRRLRDQLGRRSDVVFLAETGDGADTIRALRELEPEIALLDVRLPGAAGFEVVAEMGAERMPAVLFLTGLDNQVLRVLEVHALDYLLEPFDDERLHRAIDRALRHTEELAREGQGRRLARLVAGDEEGSRERRVPVRSAAQVQFVPLDEVRWVEGAGSYSRLHLYDGGTHLLNLDLDELAGRFADDFLRVHRSTLVRSSEVAEIRIDDDGDALVALRDGRELRISRRDRDRLEPVVRSVVGRGVDG